MVTMIIVVMTVLILIVTTTTIDVIHIVEIATTHDLNYHLRSIYRLHKRTTFESRSTFSSYLVALFLERFCHPFDLQLQMMEPMIVLQWQLHDHA